MEKTIKKVTKETVTKSEVSDIKLPELIDLLQAGCHFGHKKSAWNPRMKQYIYDERNGIHIIDLVKTQELLKEAIEGLGKLCAKGHVLMVGTKGQAASIVQEVARESGAFYVNKRWPGGLFTNFDTIKRSIQGLVKMEEEIAKGGENLVKKEIIMMQKEITKLNMIYEGIKFMDRLPVAIIVVDSKVEKIAVKEARKVGIPVISMIDTNSDPDLIDYPIPCNDDSLKSIKLMLHILGQVIGKSKSGNSLVSLRQDHIAVLEKLGREYIERKEREEKMEQEDRERMKALREGKVAVAKGTVVRVVKKEKDLTEDIKKAEEVKMANDSKSIDDLGLSARIVKALKEAGIKTLVDITGKKKEQLIEIKGIGEKAADDILKAIK
ncbi:MAG: 30S ribosomal protein S2 [Candidatus Dojkabacteria bacterium]|nr:30S ribosomal protein S2 [Candidatus Dojkabacteria bacterium]